MKKAVSTQQAAARIRPGAAPIVGLAAFGAMAAMRCSDPMLGTLAALAGSLNALVLARALMGATAAGIVPLSMAWIGDSVDYAERQETLARLLSAAVSGMIAGQWLGAWIAQSLGWRLSFAALVPILLTASWLLLRSASSGGEPVRRETSFAPYASLRLLARARVRGVLAVTAIEGGLMFGVLAFAPSVLAQRFGLTMASAGGLVALFGAGGLAYSRMARRLLAKLGERGLALAGASLAGASLLMLAWAPHWPLALPSCLFAGAGFYMLHATLQTQATQMVPQHRGTAMALFSSVLFLGQTLGVVAMSAAVDRGRAAEAMGACALGLVALGIAVSRGVGESLPARACP